MKTILVGTDFTPSSYNAGNYAAILAKKLGCKLVLFNIYEVPALHTNSGLYFISSEAIRENTEEKMERQIKELKASFNGIKVESLVATGSFSKLIEEFIAKHRVQAVVMGLAAKTKLSKFIYGSHTTDIAGKLTAPVIIVPEKYKQHQVKTILLGVDNTEKLIGTPLKQFVALSNELKAKVKSIHVRTADEILVPEKKEIHLGSKTQKVDGFFAKNIQDGLNKYARLNACDMICVVSRAHSAFYDLFAENNTKKIAFVSKIPVMSIHE